MVIPDDVYREDVDFSALAMRYADFAKRLKVNGQLDFSGPESVRQLTKALLYRDFDLKINLPEDRLCPPVPNRFNYIIFIQRLVDSTRPDYRGSTPQDEQILGLDIGTGASAIYPMLACRYRMNWYFLATEIDHKSREYANNNVNINNLESRIKIVPPDDLDQGEERSTLLPTSQFKHLDDHAIKIQITNPPFYSSQQEMLESARQKSRPPNSACTGAPIEMITKGGEIEFVTRLINESTHPLNRVKIQWFSSMLGKLSSLGPIIEKLKQVNCDNYVVTEFVQGSKTKRWCIAWSWMGWRPPSSLARGVVGLEKRLLPFPTDYEFDVDMDWDSSSPISRLQSLLNEELFRLDGMQWEIVNDSNVSNNDRFTGIGQTQLGDTWSRKSRRKRQQKCQQQGMKDGDGEEDQQMKDTNDLEEKDKTNTTFAFRVTVFIINNNNDDETTMNRTLQPSSQKDHSPSNPNLHPNPNPKTKFKVRVTWLKGMDQITFESFTGWLKRKVTTSLLS